MRKTYPWLGMLVLGALLLALIGCAGSGAPKVDWEIKITGAMEKPMTVTYADLVKNDLKSNWRTSSMQRSQGEDSYDTWEGPAL